jgi:hypothetical protein
MFANPRRLIPITAALLLARAAVAEDAASAIKTPGSARLTMCRSWLFFSTCRDYYNVAVPARIALGDHLALNFGSNPKTYEFPVLRIVRQGEACMLLDDPSGDDCNRIEIASCPDATGSH